MKAATLSKPVMVRSFIINSAALVLIYFTPALSHLLNFPLYLIEPMRLMVILAMVHGSRSNAYLLALTLPLFSYAVSAHPVFYKMLLISAELTLNVWLFYLLNNRLKNSFIAMIGGILLSKVAYYVVKAILISFAVAGPGLFSTPVWIQFITTLIFGVYATIVLTKKSN